MAVFVWVIKQKPGGLSDDNEIKCIEKKGGCIMDKHGNCCDCGGSNGNHFDGCIYDGTDEGYSSYSRSRSGNVSEGKWWLGYIIALIIGYGINELLGAIILIGLIFWLWAK